MKFFSVQGDLASSGKGFIEKELNFCWTYYQHRPNFVNSTGLARFIQCPHTRGESAKAWFFQCPHTQGKLRKLDFLQCHTHRAGWSRSFFQCSSHAVWVKEMLFQCSQMGKLFQNPHTELVKKNSIFQSPHTQCESLKEKLFYPNVPTHKAS